MVRARGRHLGTLAAVAAAYVVVVAAGAVISRNESVTALVALIGTALIIAWQSLETARAATAAEEGLHGAADSLRVSQVLAIEAERRRLDAEGPRLVVRVNEPEWPPRVGQLYLGSEPAQLPHGEVFRLPKDETRLLTIRADGFIRNEGDRTVRVSLHGMRVERAASGDGYPNMEWTERGDHDLDIGPDTVEQFRFDNVRPASDWISNTEAGERGDAEPTTGIGVVVATDGNDNGIIDTWEVEVSGCPFDRIEGEQGGWRLHKDLLTGKGPMVAQVRPRVRSYFRSKVHNQELPQVELPPLAGPLGGTG